MGPTEARVTKPERRWDCRHGTPNMPQTGPVKIRHYQMKNPAMGCRIDVAAGLNTQWTLCIAERGTGRLSAAQLAGLVWSLADSHRVVRTRLVLGFGGWLMGPHCGLSLRGCFVQPWPSVIPDQMTCFTTGSYHLPTLIYTLIFHKPTIRTIIKQKAVRKFKRPRQQDH